MIFLFVHVCTYGRDPLSVNIWLLRFLLHGMDGMLQYGIVDTMLDDRFKNNVI